MNATGRLAAVKTAARNSGRNNARQLCLAESNEDRAFWTGVYRASAMKSFQETGPLCFGIDFDAAWMDEIGRVWDAAFKAEVSRRSRRA